MCGIIGMVVGSNVRVNRLKKRFRDIYLQQSNRGTQGGGMWIQKLKGDKLLLRSKNPEEVLDELCYKIGNAELSTGDMVLFHHRYPTCTPNEEKFNHPLKSGKITLIHNGMISNADDAVKGYEDKVTTWHEKNTYYKNYTDSEIMSILLDEAIGAKKKLKPEHVLMGIKHLSTKVKGTLAIAFTHDNDDRIWLFRYSNPIVVYSDNHGNKFFSSEYPNTTQNPLGGFKDKYELKSGEYGFIDAGGYVKCGIVDSDIMSGFAMSVKNYYGNNSRGGSYYDVHKGDYVEWDTEDDYALAKADSDYDDDVEEFELRDIRNSSQKSRNNIDKMLALYKTAPLFDKLTFTPYEEILKYKKECALDGWSSLFKDETFKMMHNMEIKGFISADLSEKTHPTKNTMMGMVVQEMLRLNKEGVIKEEALGEIMKALRPVMTKSFDDLAYENMFLFRLSNLLKLKIQCFEMSIKNMIDDLDSTRSETGQKLYELLMDYENYYDTERSEFMAMTHKTEENIFGFSAEDYKKDMDNRISSFNQKKLTDLVKSEEKIKEEFITLNTEKSEEKAISMLFNGIPNAEYQKGLLNNTGY